MPGSKTANSSLEAVSQILALTGGKLYGAIADRENPIAFAQGLITAEPKGLGGKNLIRITVAPAEGDKENHEAYKVAKLLRTVLRATGYNPGFAPEPSLRERSNAPLVFSTGDDMAIQEAAAHDFTLIDPLSVKQWLKMLNDQATATEASFAGFGALLNVTEPKSALMSAILLHEELRRGGFLERGTEAAVALANAGSLQPWGDIEITKVDGKDKIVGREDGRILDKITEVYERCGVKLRESGTIIPERGSPMAMAGIREDRAALSKIASHAIQNLALDLVVPEDFLPSASDMDGYRKEKRRINPELGAGRGIGGKKSTAD